MQRWSDKRLSTLVWYAKAACGSKRLSSCSLDIHCHRKSATFLRCDQIWSFHSLPFHHLGKCRASGAGKICVCHHQSHPNTYQHSIRSQPKEDNSADRERDIMMPSVPPPKDAGTCFSMSSMETNLLTLQGFIKSWECLYGHGLQIPGPLAWK